MQYFGCFCYLNMKMSKFCNCQDEQGARQKATQKNLKFSLQKQRQNIYRIISMQSLL